MGFLSGLANISGLQAANVYNNPEQAAVGANTPESTYALNKTAGPTMDKHYTPTTNMAGGYTQGEMQQNAAQGYDNTGAQAANAAGAAAAMYFTGGAATPLVMGQAAADQYARAHPHSNFNQEYNGIIASNPNINAGLSTSGYGSGYSYAKGGAVEQPSGLHDIAKHVQSQGRGEDTVLVHMTPNEVGGLQALAKAKGGTLTRNPQTGLYEAGFLSSMLPMIAGAALTVASDGALAPWAAGLMVGAGDYAITGSLQQGLMAGLGAWSGAGLGAGLADIGSAAAPVGDVTAASEANAANWGSEDTVGKAVLEDVPKTSMAQNALTGLQNVATSAPAAGSFIANNAMPLAGAVLPAVSGALFKQNTVNPVTSVNTVNQPLARLSPDYKGTQPTPPPNPYQAKYPNYVQTPYNPATGLPAPQSPGTQYSSAVTAAEGGLMGIQKYAAGGGVSQVNPAQTDFMAGGGMYPQSLQDHTQFATPSQMPASAALMNSDFDTKTNPLTGAATGPGMAGGGLTAFAQGSQKPVGNKDMAAIDDYTAQAQEEGGIASIKEAADKGDWNAMLALQKLGYKAGGGGVSSLGSYSDGGHLLKGPGDGVSDSIPAQIGAHQPARLADGEFVVPARIVSELGNGSTDAGAKRLYAMMQRVQAKRKKSMGKGKFAVNSKAENDLPA